MMSDLQNSYAQLVSRCGPFTGHNYHIKDGLWTIGVDVHDNDQHKLHRVIQTLSLFGKLKGAKILDLGALEGLYTIELLRQGATVTVVEGRERNMAKIRWACAQLDFAYNVHLYEDDVRNMAQHGNFDVILCLGILYHLDGPSLASMLRNIAAQTSFVIIDTHVRTDEESDEWVDVDGFKMQGCQYREHPELATLEQRLQSNWSSLDNTFSFWPDKASLINGLKHVGFNVVLETHMPWQKMSADRVHLVALRDSNVWPVSCPGLEEREKA